MKFNGFTVYVLVSISTCDRTLEAHTLTTELREDLAVIIGGRDTPKKRELLANLRLAGGVNASVDSHRLHGLYRIGDWDGSVVTVLPLGVHHPRRAEIHFVLEPICTFDERGRPILAKKRK